MRAPHEFYHFAGHFVDLTPDRSATPDDIYNFAVSSMNRREKEILIEFFSECLDGTHTETELRKLWNGTSARIAVAPFTRFFRNLSERLAVSLQDASDGAVR